MQVGDNDWLEAPPFDVGSFFNLSVGSITIGAAVVIGFYAFEAMI